MCWLHSDVVSVSPVPREVYMGPDFNKEDNLGCMHLYLHMEIG